MRPAVGGADSSGVREAPMSFGTQPRGGRSIRIATGGTITPDPSRPWEKRPETFLLYVGPHQAMEVKP